jgi:hypothetical protein
MHGWGDDAANAGRSALRQPCPHRSACRALKGTALAHAETRLRSSLPPEDLFARLDDQQRLGAHMQKRSWMMGGGLMRYGFDAAKGREVGSRVSMEGSAFGLALALEEQVVERTPPKRKLWRTLGEPRLVVVGPYELGFEVSPARGGSEARLWMDWRSPARGVGRWLGKLFGGVYAAWCLRAMAQSVR